MPIYLSTTLFNFEGNVRYAAILGYVGAGGIGMILNDRVNNRDYTSVGMILLGFTRDCDDDRAGKSSDSSQVDLRRMTWQI